MKWEPFETCSQCRQLDSGEWEKCTEHSKPPPEEEPVRLRPVIRDKISAREILDVQLRGGVFGQASPERLHDFEDLATEAHTRLQWVIRRGLKHEADIALWMLQHPKYKPNPALKDISLRDTIFMMYCPLDGEPVQRKTRQTPTRLCPPHYREFKKTQRWNLNRGRKISLNDWMVDYSHRMRIRRRDFERRYHAT